MVDESLTVVCRLIAVPIGDMTMFSALAAVCTVDCAIEIVLITLHYITSESDSYDSGVTCLSRV